MSKILVDNWRQGWKWVSSWCLAMVIYLTTFPLPEELLNVLPETIRLKVVGVIAVIGFVMRFVDQASINSRKNKPK